MSSEISAEDKLAARRLSGLLEYVDALVKLDERPATRLAQHKLADGSQFVLHQHELAALPGVVFDTSDSEGPIWLCVERLQRTTPPTFDDELKRWLDVSNDPLKPPVIRETHHLRLLEAEKSQLVELCEARPEDCVPAIKPAEKDEAPGVYFDVMLRLEDRQTLRKKIEAYCAGPWSEWAEREKPLRRSIDVYQRLFEIAQRLLQSGSTESIELIWGIGVSRWNRAAEAVDLPMVERSIEIEIANQTKAAITVRPRYVAARVELRPFEKLAPAQITTVEDAARRCMRAIEAENPEGVSPFKSETFEPILKICGGQLDPEGRYLPDHLQLAPTEPVPAATDETLTVSDRYVLFARRRSNNSVLRDIERFKAILKPTEGDTVILEGATRTLVMGPTDGINDIYQPLGDRIGASDDIGNAMETEPVDPDHGDLFFPKPFNDDQVQIIRRLEKSDGLVVQGPPGTGKTHTIANIVSHMLATGRRVLVVSHGETALKVIRDQLPEGVRDLAISVTTSEREGMKQVERAIGLMLGIVNTIDGSQARQRNLIRELEIGIVHNRKRLVQIDARLAAIAETHLATIPGSSEKPYNVAQRVIADRPAYEWFSDRPATLFGDTRISEEMIASLTAARRRVGADLFLINERLPNPANLPDPATLLSWHRDLITAKSLEEGIAQSEPRTRRAIEAIGADEAEKLSSDLKQYATDVENLMTEPWAWSLIERQRVDLPAMSRVRPMALAFLDEARQAVDERKAFISKPVELPDELPPSDQWGQILVSLIDGKNPFGFLAFKLKPYQPAIEQIRVSGLMPARPEDWQHVGDYVRFQEKIISLSTRWVSLRSELGIADDVSFSIAQIANLDRIGDQLQTALIDFPSSTQRLTERLTSAFSSQEEALEIINHHVLAKKFGNDLASHVASTRLNGVKERIKETAHQFSTSKCSLAINAIQILQTIVGDPNIEIERLERVWAGIRAKLAHLSDLGTSFDEIRQTTDLLTDSGAPDWAKRLQTEVAIADNDPAMPRNWKAAWEWAVNMNYLERIGATSDLSALHAERMIIEKELRDGFSKLVKERTFFNLAVSMKGTAKAALRAFADIIRRLGRGTGQRAALYRQDSRRAMENCYDAVPCWIMPTWRVSEQLPATLNAFDLVILDEASQSDARELPALLRGKKILVVGDDRQISPSAAFLSIANIERLRENYLSEFPFRSQVEPGASLYDLARVMFPDKFVMLKEHFRCVEPIIRFSMQFYNEPLVPLRVPKGTERLDPPLIDILVEGGERRGKSKVNLGEAEVILAEIEQIINNPEIAMLGGAEGRPRSIGVISLIGSEQAAYIQKQLMERIGEAAMMRHRIVCGDSASLQGDERDIIFLSMIADKTRKQAQTAMQYEQRFNVALSRARDRIVLVRSVKEEDLNPKDLKAKIISHFREPMPQVLDANAKLIDLCQSGFERDLFTVLTERGYKVTPQVGSEGFYIDMVVEGESGRRLAVECDGDQYHGPERWADDMRRQRILERVGWTFWRCFGSNYTLDREGALDDLFQILDRMEIKPTENFATTSSYTEHRIVRNIDNVINTSAIEGSSPAIMQAANNGATLAIGDRVVIRFLDDEHAKPELYVLTDGATDPLNGLLSLSSPLASALVDAAPGDEIAIRIDNRERHLLLMSVESDIRHVS